MNKLINIGKEILIQYIISKIDFNNGKVKDSYIWVEHCNIKLPIKSFIKRHQYEIISNQDYVIISKAYLSILDIFKIQTNNSLKEYIKFEDNYLNVSISQNMQKGIDNYSQHEYNRFIQEYLKL